MKRVVYMGTPGFATGPLRALLDAGYEVAAVVTAPDKPAGRGLNLLESEVKRFASDKGLKILQPVSLKDPDFLKELMSLDAPLFVVVAFRMLPKEVWSMPELGCFNLHASLLPNYRGAAPINHAIINGETETGVTTFFIDDKIDTGEILFQERCPIDENENAGSLHDKLMAIGSGLVVKTADSIYNGEALPYPQRVEDAIIKPAPKLTRETGKIDWGRGAKEIYNQIRGLSPYPTAYSELVFPDKTLQVKIFESEIVYLDKPYPKGTIIRETKSSFLVFCGENCLRINELQPSGKRRMKASEFMAGIRDLENCKMR